MVVADEIAEMPVTVRSPVIVGGYAVKLGLVSPMPNAELMADISSL